MNNGLNPVMLVDDDAAVRNSLARLLTSAHLPFAMFENAEDFLANLPAAAPACVILDIHLPGKSGLDLQQILAERHPTVPIVIITGIDDEHAEKRALAAGAIAFLRKPFDAEALLDVLKKSQLRPGKP
jgi:FixJ family two-component response regulator